VPGQHATLSPSGAERWISCPASVRLTADMPNESSKYAMEGTCCHALADIEARLSFGMITPAEATRERNMWRKHWQQEIGLTEEQEEEMANHVAAYLVLIHERVSAYPDSQVLFEQRVPTGIPSSWGTSDTVIVSPVHVEIIDLKYGMGVRVSAAGNPQLRLYGVGALEGIGDLLGDPETVTMTVFQPRLDHTDSETMAADDLREWRDSLLPVAELALGEDAPFGPSEDACRWCPAAGQCRAQLEWATQADFGTPAEMLSPEELAEVLKQVDAIEKWCEQVRAVGLDLIYTKGQPVPGWKAVRSGGRRSIPAANQEAAIEAMLAAGHSIAEVSTRKAKGIGELERLLSKPKFAAIVEPFVVKGQGSVSLAPEDDKRPAINPNTEAVKEFTE
jgi:hypothetical protein